LRKLSPRLLLRVFPLVFAADRPCNCTGLGVVTHPIMSFPLPLTFSLTAVLVAGVLPLPTQAADVEPLRVACVGDSITFGAGTEFPRWDSYPSQLQRLLGGDDYVVGNFGSSGSTLLNAGDQPYQQQNVFNQALKFRPDIVVIQLGTNDTKPRNWEHRDAFVADYEALVDQFQALEPRPEIYLCLPPYTSHMDPKSINEPVLREVLPMIKQVAREKGTGLIDVHAAFLGRDDLLKDGVHPHKAGAGVLARTVCAALTGRDAPAEVPDTLNSQWKGYRRVDFDSGHRVGTLILPKEPAPGRPWIWRTEFLGAFPSVDLALLERGWHLAYVDVQNLYGAPVALDAMDGFRAELAQHHQLTAKPVLEGFSRGGLFAFNWAARHPDDVAALYVDAPVCDFKSWPAGRGTGKGSVADWERCLKAYGLTEEAALVWPGNPVDNLAPLAAAKIPIIAVAGDADDVVPPKENIGVVETRYRELGGEIKVIVKPGVGHHPHSLEDPAPVVEFLVAKTSSR
jgi:lysophospholipase L1-like esterase/pimeloyl-ACP methyl ester carboxylesterase